MDAELLTVLLAVFILVGLPVIALFSGHESK